METQNKNSITRFLPTLNMRSVTRISLDRVLREQFAKLKPGIVLDVGAKYSPYKQYIPYTKYLTLDTDKSAKPDICSDLHHIDWADNYFDTVIATEVLEHLYDPALAIKEVHRILKPGGTCVASTRFLYMYHPDPQDYYRFTWDSLNHIFKAFTKVDVYHHGNRLLSIWQLLNTNYDKWRVFLNVFNPLIGRIHFAQTAFPCGFVVYAQK